MPSYSITPVSRHSVLPVDADAGCALTVAEPTKTAKPATIMETLRRKVIANPLDVEVRTPPRDSSSPALRVSVMSVPFVWPAAGGRCLGHLGSLPRRGSRNISEMAYIEHCYDSRDRRTRPRDDVDSGSR